jgi:hypothetical protein
VVKNTLPITFVDYCRIFNNLQYSGKQKIKISDGEYIFCDVYQQKIKKDYVSLRVEFESSEDMLMFKLKYQL